MSVAGRTIRVVTALLFVAAGVVIVGSPSANATSSGVWWLMNQNSQKCVNIQGASTDDGANAIQWDCKPNTDNETFRFTYNSSGDYWTIKNTNSGKCLDVQGASTSNGAQVIQWTCNGHANQAWQPIYVDTVNKFDYYEYANLNSSKCLNVQQASTANGASIIQYTCSVATNNLWAQVEVYGITARAHVRSDARR